MQYSDLKIEVTDGHVVLSVTDTETFDFIEDILAEKHGLEWSYMATDEVDGKPIYTAHFLEMKDPKRLQIIVNDIDQDELQRIWNLNN
ncbi:hypothetical protein ROLI_002380 [Roseobacter fucihabitans]|uniref:Uncharacterized protein n=1 Tax=Roseobacter fucihabitans TaxID=1537242 RepID=A0ABZ2BN27_9RHOB|nr:hypothetical protein [Roseobacter litoralis]MBC6963489.1 hypothetical protein [Roseobacter litoralis]